MRRTRAFGTPFTFTSWHIGLLNVSLLSLGVIVRSRWPQRFVGWSELILALFVVPAFFVSYGALTQV
jgi:hypothetical protein